VFAYNNGVHATTGYSPYELAFGRQQKSPFDSIAPFISISSSNDFYKKIQRIRKIILSQARNNIRQQQEEVKQRYNHHRTDASYTVGDLVFVKVCAGRTKLDERWSGPYSITDKIGDQTYILQDDETGRMDRAHVCQLQPVVSRHY